MILGQLVEGVGLGHDKNVKHFDSFTSVLDRLLERRELQLLCRGDALWLTRLVFLAVLGDELPLSRLEGAFRVE